MAATDYKDYSLVFMSKGIQARNVDDTIPPQYYLNLDNCEELFENAFSQRLGVSILNKDSSGNVYALGIGTPVVNTLAKLCGLNNPDGTPNVWRYAATADGQLYRLSGSSPGQYIPLTLPGGGLLSGEAIWGVSYRPDISSTPYIYFADRNRMVKDNGSSSILQQTGIFQPRYPITAQVGEPYVIVLDDFANLTGVGVTGGVTTGLALGQLTTTGTVAAGATGLQHITVGDISKIFPFALVHLGGSPSPRIVVEVDGTGFIANIPSPNTGGLSGVAINYVQFVVASGAATPNDPGGILRGITPGRGTFPSNIPLRLQDYVSFSINVSDSTLIQTIRLIFNVGPLSGGQDYFYKVIGQDPTATLLENTDDPQSLATDTLLADTMQLYASAADKLGALNTGKNVWTTLLFQLSDFSAAGRADINDPAYNWNNINYWQLQVVPVTPSTGTNSVTIQVSSLVLFGGYGADSLGGVAYDYRYTFYNNVDGTESNPSMAMSNIDPPTNTMWVVPRRQPVQLSLAWSSSIVPYSLDLQVTSVRIYRRGGTLGDNWRRLDEVVIPNRTAAGLVYIDATPDEQLAPADFLSLENDVPVTSTLPVPVNTTLSDVGGVNPSTLVFPFTATPTVFGVASTANMSVGQQILIGSPTDPLNTFEIAVVLQVNTAASQITAYVQNPHYYGKPVSATASYGQPVDIQCLAYGSMYYAGDRQNPHFLYFSAPGNPQAVGSDRYVEVGTPDDPITVIASIKGNLYVSTKKYWWAVAPGSQGKPTVYPTTAKHGCVAKFGFCVTENGIYYQSNDGIRFFAGGGGQYLTQEIEFIFQGNGKDSWQKVGVNPIVNLDFNHIADTCMAYWNNMIFCSYVGTDGNRHRVILHTIYQRWRNDDSDAYSMLLEEDVNALVIGDNNGIVYLDRQLQPYDENAAGTAVAQVGIAIRMQTAYNNFGMFDIQKQFNELTVDVNTQGQTLNAQLWYDDGQSNSGPMTFSSAQRGKYNLIIPDPTGSDSGLGVAHYNVSLEIWGTVNQWVYIYGSSIKAAPLAKTRKSLDTYEQNLGTDQTKFSKNVFIDYNSTAPVNCTVRYDDVPRFNFTLPNTNGARRVVRVRLPAIAFRLYRFTATSTGDFQVWGGSYGDYKVQAFGVGYQKYDFNLNQ